MDQLFIGMLFILFDFNLSLGGFTIGLVPDFVGYLLALAGLGKLAQESPILSKCRTLAGVFAVYSLLSYGVNLFGLTANVFIIYIISLVEVILRLYFIYQLVQGLKQLEIGRPIELYTEKLHKYWALMTAFQVFSLLLIMSLLLSAVCTVVSFVFSILFILKLNMGRINWKNGMALYH